MWNLLQALWLHCLAAGGVYLAGAMAVLLWLGNHPPRSQAERAIVGLLALLVLIVIGTSYAYARRTAVLAGQVQTGWVIACVLMLTAAALAAAFVTLVALNQ